MGDLGVPAPKRPDLDALLEKARNHVMTEDEIADQRASWVRAFTTPCEHGELDWEQCGPCRDAARSRKDPTDV
ncbi:hypothetical protein [Amorphus sp. MBR-141]